MNPLAMATDLADRAGLLCRHVSDARGGVGNGADGADDLVQRPIGRLRLAGGRLCMLQLGTQSGLLTVLRMCDVIMTVMAICQNLA